MTPEKNSDMKYPFIPKSNIKLEKGEYWSLPLRDRVYSYFVVLDLPDSKNRTAVFLGLLEYTSDKPVLDSKKHKIIWQASLHVKTIKECGGMIQGKIAPIEPTLELDSAGGDYCHVVSGYKTIRKATIKDIKELSVQKTSGFNVPKIIATKMANDS